MKDSKIGVRIPGLLMTCAVFVVALAAQDKRFAYPESPIDASRLAAHVRVLASDAFEGRAPATSGEMKTVDYITRQLAAVGVKPGGDPDGKGGRRWTQDVPLVQSDIQGTHFSFAKVDVPAISFRAGLDRVEGGVAAGKAAYDEYIAVGNSRVWPAWKDGSEFKAIRDTTSSSRK